MASRARLRALKIELAACAAALGAPSYLDVACDAIGAGDFIESLAASFRPTFAGRARFPSGFPNRRTVSFTLLHTPTPPGELTARERIAFARNARNVRRVRGAMRESSTPSLPYSFSSGVVARSEHVNAV